MSTYDALAPESDVGERGAVAAVRVRRTQGQGARRASALPARDADAVDPSELSEMGTRLRRVDGLPVCRDNSRRKRILVACLLPALMQG